MLVIMAKQKSSTREKVTLFPAPPSNPGDENNADALKQRSKAIKVMHAANEELISGKARKAQAFYVAGSKYRGEPFPRDRQHTGTGRGGRTNPLELRRSPTDASSAERALAATAVATAITLGIVLGAGKIAETTEEPAPELVGHSAQVSEADMHEPLHEDPAQQVITP